MLSVHRGLQDIFDLNVGCANMYRFRECLAKYYRSLRDEILATVLTSDVIHIDETPVKLRKTVGYVWVVSSEMAVCYIFRNTREGAFLQDILGEYQGVLISDFFTAYDSLSCPQQKCLVHLMRDINDDLRREPYNDEMRSIAEPFGRLLKEIVLTIDKYGCVADILTNMSNRRRSCALQLRTVSLLLSLRQSINKGSRNTKRSYLRFCDTMRFHGTTTMPNTPYTILQN